MYVTIHNSYGNVDFTTAHYEEFKSHVVAGRKTDAIKFIRTSLPSWGLKECKDFVENCFFPPVVQSASAPKEDTAFLNDIKDDIRNILVTDTQYRESLLIDLFGRVCTKVGLSR